MLNKNIFFLKNYNKQIIFKNYYFYKYVNVYNKYIYIINSIKIYIRYLYFILIIILLYQFNNFFKFIEYNFFLNNYNFNKSKKNLIKLYTNYNFFFYLQPNFLIAYFNRKKISLLFWVNIFLKNYFQIKTKLNCSVSFIPYNYYVNSYLNSNYIFFSKLYKRYYFLRPHQFFCIRLLDVLLILFISKDLIFFKNWLNTLVEKLPFKSHRKFFYFLKLFIKKYLNFYSTYFNICGFYLKIKGKIGVGGNAKKRTYTIKYGKYSLTKKSLKLNYERGRIRTITGVLGYKIYISYI